MDYSVIVPSSDALALPAPYWVLKSLLILTFILHIIAMNFLLGGGVIALFAKWKAKRKPEYLEMYSLIKSKLPNFMAATITLGVAPLLFLQVIYGQYFYTSSVIIGWLWLSVVLILIIAYYGLYYSAMNKGKSATAGTWVLLSSLLLLFLIGFIYSNNFTLMITPASWAEKYFADPSGLSLNMEEHTLYSRYIHFMIAAVSFGGLFASLTGVFLWNKNRTFSLFLQRTGSKWFVTFSIIQIFAGTIFLISLPTAQLKLFMGGNFTATLLFVISFILTILIIERFLKASQTDDPRKPVIFGSVLTLVVVAAMSVMRDILRDNYLCCYFNPNKFNYDVQWDVMIIFFVLLTGGILLVGYMLKRYFKSTLN